MRGPKPKGRVETTWRPELAYAVGLITADGSLSCDGRHINFTSKDIDLIKTFQDCLKLDDIKVGIKASGYSRKRQYHQVQFGDVLFYRWLESIGLHPNKSKTISRVDVPDEFLFDFVRGEWDGDGTIYRFQDKRWKSSYLVSIGFASGSKKFLEWLRERINSQIHTTGHIVNANHHTYQLRYAKTDSKVLFHKTFYQKDLPYLRRKFTKATEIFRIDGLKKE